MGKEAEKWQEELWEKLVDKISATSSRTETKKILENLLSNYEKRTVLRRLAVKALVQSGKTYQEIGEILWMSPQTISTTKKNILSKQDNYKSYKHFYGGPIKSSIGKEKIKKPVLDKLFEDIDIWDLITNPPRPTGMGIKNHRLY